MSKVKVVFSGPLFTGEADKAAADLSAALVREIALIGQTWIKTEAHGFDKSGRGGTGKAADGVHLTGAGTSYVISGGIRQGEYAWPWLEGTSQRNTTTGFKGYGTFRRTTLRLRRQVNAEAKAVIAQYLERMGGMAA